MIRNLMEYLKTQKNISFKIGRLAFKDSLAFLPSSLDKLIKNLKYTDKKLNDDWENNFNVTKSNNNRYIKNNEDLNLLTEEGTYPYDFMDDTEKMELTELPHKFIFNSKLK